MSMQNQNNTFFKLTNDAFMVELYYRQEYENYKYLHDIYTRFNKGSRNQVKIAKLTSEDYEKRLSDTIKIVEISFHNIKSDKLVQSYYDLYRERSELIKNYSTVMIEIQFIKSTLKYDKKMKSNKELIKKINSLQKHNKLTFDRIEEINCDLDMFTNELELV